MDVGKLFKAILLCCCGEDIDDYESNNDITGISPSCMIYALELALTLGKFCLNRLSIGCLWSIILILSDKNVGWGCPLIVPREFCCIYCCG